MDSPRAISDRTIHNAVKRQQKILRQCAGGLHKARQSHDEETILTATLRNWDKISDALEMLDASAWDAAALRPKLYDCLRLLQHAFRRRRRGDFVLRLAALQETFLRSLQHGLLFLPYYPVEKVEQFCFIRNQKTLKGHKYQYPDEVPLINFSVVWIDEKRLYRGWEPLEEADTGELIRAAQARIMLLCGYCLKRNIRLGLKRRQIIELRQRLDMNHRLIEHVLNAKSA